jgi:hypothetical protein
MNSESDIKNEEKLLLALCRLTFTVAQKEKISELTQSVTDWEYFVQIANSHGLAALSGYNLDSLNLTGRIPDEITSILKNSRLKILSRNTFLAETMTEVLELLNKADIKTVLLKGIALEMSDYGNLGLRQMTDVDILIEQKRCIEARNILLHNGFESLPVKSFLHKPILVYTGKHLPSLLKNGASIEIHHSLFGDKKNYLTRLLTHESIRTSLNKHPVYVPSPQLHFLFLVKHLYRHEMNNESQLRLYTDLFILLDKYGDQIINYDLLELVSKAGMSDILAWKLKLLRDFWDMSFPGWINDFIDKRHHPDIINRFLFFLKNPKNNPPFDKAIVYQQIIKDISGLHRKLLFITGDIFPSVTFMKKRYNCSTLKAITHYPARLGKLWWLMLRRRPAKRDSSQ